MRELKVWNVMTLDGYFEGKEPWDLDFHMTAWGDELEAFSDAQMQEVGTLLFGRKTYLGMYDFWSKEGGNTGDALNRVEKAVISNTIETAEWDNTRLLKGDAVEQVKALKQEEGKDIFVFGSAELLASLLEAGLVDEYRLCVAPVVLGQGTPLFKPGKPRLDFTLAESRPLETGGLLSFYRRK